MQELRVIGLQFEPTEDFPTTQSPTSMVPYQTRNGPRICLVTLYGPISIDPAEQSWTEISKGLPKNCEIVALAPISMPNSPELNLIGASKDGVYLFDSRDSCWFPLQSFNLSGKSVRCLCQLPGRQSLRIAWGSDDGLEVWSQLNGKSYPEGSQHRHSRTVKGPVTALSVLKGGASNPNLIVGAADGLMAMDVNTYDLRELAKLSVDRGRCFVNYLDTSSGRILAAGRFSKYCGADRRWQSARNLLCSDSRGVLSSLGGGCGDCVTGIADLGNRFFFATGSSMVKTTSGMAFFDGSKWQAVEDQAMGDDGMALCRIGNSVFANQLDMPMAMSGSRLGSSVWEFRLGKVSVS